MQINMEKYFLNPGCIFVSEHPYLICTVLGSCISVCIWDSVKKYGGMNHYIYSRPRKGQQNARYGIFSIPYLILLMIRTGSRYADLKAHIVGGASNSEMSSAIGRENSILAEKILKENNIAIITKDVGGQVGRKVIFNNISGEILVYKGVNIRRSDWYSNCDE